MAKLRYSLFVAFLAFSAASQARTRIGVLCAIPEEMEHVHKALKSIPTAPGETSFSQGTVGDVEVVLGLSGVGKVNAAIAAQKLVTAYNVEAILFTGVAGGLSPELEIGDVLFATSSFQHDYGFLGRSFVARLPGTLPELNLGDPNASIRYPVGAWGASPAEETARYFEASARYLSPVRVGTRLLVPRVRRGVVATGDQFIANDTKRAELRAMGGDVVEMEGAAVAQVAQKGSVPLVLIRAVSDKAGAEAVTDFPKFFKEVGANNAALVIRFLGEKRFLDSLSR